MLVCVLAGISQRLHINVHTEQSAYYMYTLCFNREYCPFHRPILKLRASHCSRIFMNMITHILFAFVLFHLGHHRAQHRANEKGKKTLTCTSIFRPTKCHRGVYKTEQKAEQQQQPGKKLTNISAFL